jgi:hypothetical protein
MHGSSRIRVQNFSRKHDVSLKTRRRWVDETRTWNVQKHSEKVCIRFIWLKVGFSSELWTSHKSGHFLTVTSRRNITFSSRILLHEVLAIFSHQSAGLSGSTSDLCSKGMLFESRLGYRLFEVFHRFPQSFQENAGILSQMWAPPFTSTFLPIRHSLIILTFDSL